MVTPPVMVAIVVLLPILDALNPWQVGEAALEEQFPDTFPLCVGASWLRFSSGRSVVTEKQRCYLLVSKGVIVVVTEGFENGHCTVTTETDRWMLWIGTICFLALIWMSVRFSMTLIKEIAERRAKGGTYTER